MEKYGFVYLWRDKKRNRFYIGCHWGREDDGYVCSSNWMRDAYKKRPEDFKRRVIARVYTNRNDMLQEEFRFLDRIKDHELGTRYYNRFKHHFGHWANDEFVAEQVRAKLSAAKWSDARKAKFSKSRRGEKRKPLSAATKLKISMAHKGRKDSRSPAGKALHAAKLKTKVPWNKGITQR